MPSDGSVDGVAIVNTATPGSGNKRKRITSDDNEVPQAKRGAKTKKELNAKVEPKEGIKTEDVHEDLGENGENADVNEEFDEGDDVEV